MKKNDLKLERKPINSTSFLAMIAWRVEVGTGEQNFCLRVYKSIIKMQLVLGILSFMDIFKKSVLILNLLYLES